MEEKQDEKFIQGFNDGFLIAASLPDLAKSLSNTEFKDERGLGLKEGIAQYERDKGLENLKSFSSKIKDTDREPDREIDLER